MNINQSNEFEIAKWIVSIMFIGFVFIGIVFISTPIFCIIGIVGGISLWIIVDKIEKNNLK